MAASSGVLNACKRESIVSFARKLQLPETFLQLHIVGLGNVLDSDKVTSKNKELIFRFLNHISPEVSESRLSFYTHKLRKLSVWLQKDFDNVTEADLRSLLTSITRGHSGRDGGAYSKGTVHGYKITLKRFYRWLEGSDEKYPRKVKWIKTSGDTTRIGEPEELLTFEEIREMIRHAGNPRDKAMISFLYESGARVSEMLSMKIRHVESTPNTVKVTLPVSKTRPRTIPLVSCKQHLANWFNYHPLKDNPEASFWSNLKREGLNPLTLQTVGKILKAIAGKAGIGKRVYPHLFRACSITHKQGNGWPDQAIKAFHGLSKDSTVMKHYSHLSYSNLEQIQRRMNGLPVDNAEGMSQGIKCPGCGRTNPLYVESCVCGLPTEMKRVQGGHSDLVSEIESRVERKIDEFLESRRAQDEIMERFMAALVEKSKRSPALLKAIGEIGIDIQEKQTMFQASAGCHN